MRITTLAAAAAAFGIFVLPATSVRADGWADSLSSRPFASAQKSTTQKPTAQRASRSSGTYSAPAVSSGGGTTGVASFYWQPQRVASGGWFNPNAMTAAHKTLPFGTRVRVTHLGNGRSVDVTINDRGPYIGGRIIDLSKAAAGQINMQGQGIAQVRMDVIGR